MTLDMWEDGMPDARRVLGAALPPPIAWSALLVAVLLGASCAEMRGALAAGTFAGVIVLRRGSAGDAVLVLAACAVAAAVGVEALKLAPGDMFRPFFAQEPGQKLLLGVRAGVVLLAMLRASESSRTRVGLLAAISALVVLSLIWRGLLTVAVVISAALLRRFGARHANPPTRRDVALVLLLPLVGLFTPPRPTQSTATPSGSLSAAIAEWRARGNLYRARGVALVGARSEAKPGEAFLALAALDFELGQPENARKVLARTLQNPASEDVQRRAVEMQRTGGNVP